MDRGSFWSKKVPPASVTCSRFVASVIVRVPPDTSRLLCGVDQPRASPALTGDSLRQTRHSYLSLDHGIPVRSLAAADFGG